MPEGDEFLRTNKKKFQTIFQIQDKLFLDRQNTRLNILWYHSKGSPDNTTYGTKSCITEVAHLCKYPRIKTEMKPGEKKIKNAEQIKCNIKPKSNYSTLVQFPQTAQKFHVFITISIICLKRYNSCHFSLSRLKSQTTLPAYLATEEGMLYHIICDVAYIR